MQKSTTLLSLVTALMSASVIAENIHPNCIRGQITDDDFITLQDVQLITDYLNGDAELSCHQILLADLDQNRQIDEIDATQLRTEILGLPNLGEFHTWGDTNLDGVFNEDDIILMHHILGNGNMFVPGLLNETSDISGDGVFSQLDLDIFYLCDSDWLNSPFEVISQ